MLKFIKHHLESISGVEIYPIVSLLLFFLVFITMVLIVMGMPKKNIEKLSNLPLDNDQNSNDHD